MSEFNIINEKDSLEFSFDAHMEFNFENKKEKEKFIKYLSDYDFEGSLALAKLGGYLKRN